MSDNIFFTGDTWALTIELLAEDDTGAIVPYDASGAGDISLGVVCSNDADAELLLPAQSADSGASGADWAAGVVVVEFPKTDTDITTYGTAYVEAQVTESGKPVTWPRYQITIKKGVLV